ncbi:MAG: PEP/pyruvate-binding domain-containing protein [Chloroflexi bacterium]|nr:PEP/pyruvate-binding domain-containing protein [Chloroflexota bacterium]MDA1269839.1 PEP/pyruvate-binding domain-containing protein [Chloroflexota bacterium]
MTILWLGDGDCHETGRVGGKAANLSRLAAGFRVPAGFCLTPELYNRWFAGVQEAASPQRTMPVELHDAVLREYQVMASRCGLEEPAVAVRSSALDEDGLTSSFAGQYDTYLNVRGSKAVSEAIVKCWDSAGGERMASYREEHGLPAESLGVAVLVQQLVPAEISGVVFSANPISGDRDEVMINATWGLGESVVSGKVTPDTLVVQKKDLKVKASYIGEKGVMTVLAEGGTEEVRVPRARRESATLDAVQTAEIAQLAIDLEREMGWPVDLEFAYHANELYLLQCRPITTL